MNETATAPTRAPRLAVDGLTITTTASRAPVVSDVSFAVHAGQTLGLVGESGSGKTTVALALLGYARRGLSIAGGHVAVDGTDVLAAGDRSLRSIRGSLISYVPQDPATALNPMLKVQTQLLEIMRRRETPGGTERQRLAEVLAGVRLDVSSISDRYPHELSGGQQQRVALAMAFALKPAVIVLDEPTTGLDVSTQRHVLDTVRELCGSHGVAGVFVSHDLAVIASLVDHVAVMYSGRLVELGGKASVFASPGHPYTHGLLRALPSPDRARRLVGMPGSPPRPGTAPPGCGFAPRCEYVQDRCSAGVPLMAPGLHSDQSVRCVRIGELPFGGPHDDAPDLVPSPRADATTLLSVRGLTASYARSAAVDSVSWTLAPRECLAVVGESGSGKTTLARCLVGLHTRWSGEVVFKGTPLAHSVRERSPSDVRLIQYVFQNPYGSLNPRRRIREILEQPLKRFYSLSANERLDRMALALENAAVEAHVLDRTPGELSGGERQRVAIARALTVEPQVLVCDEITSALDVSVQAAIVETLRRLQEERSLALVFITHNLALVRSIAQRVVVMRHGRVVESGPTEDVLGHPGADYTRKLLTDVPKLDSYDVPST